MKNKSSYQRRIDDLSKSWEILQRIGDLELQLKDGLTEEKFFEKFKNIVYGEIFCREEDSFGECPMCGRYSQHTHFM